MGNQRRDAHLPDYGVDDLFADGDDVPFHNLDVDPDKHDLKWQEAERYAQDTKLRIKLTHWIKWLIPAWLASVVAVLTLSMFFGGLDSSVLIALLTTTTVNILGLPYIVLKGLFDKK